MTPDRAVDLCICFLCTDFVNTIIWESWRSDDGDSRVERRIGFVTHPRPENAWYLPYSVPAPVDTRWGDVSLVQAELHLVATALHRFPNTKQLLLISGDAVPIRPREDFLAWFVDHGQHPTSTLMLATDVVPLCPTEPLLAQLELERLYNGHQFITLARHHADYLLSGDGQARIARLLGLQYHTPRFHGNFNPDEVVLHTILANTFHRCEFEDTHFVEFLLDGLHAKTIQSLDEFATLFETSAQTQTVFCIRKVSKQLQWPVYRFLADRGIVNHV